MSVTVSIDGDPTTKSRARRSRSGNFYTPRQTADAEETIRWRLLAAGIQPDADHDLSVTIEFRTSTRQRRDLDNLVKLVLDACNGFAWYDDVQVVELHATVKRAHPEPGITLVIEQRESLVRTCARCGTRLSKDRSKQTRFCSRGCYDAAQRTGGSVPCAHCGETVYRQRSSSSKRTFCGQECKNAFQRGRPRPPGKWQRPSDMDEIAKVLR
jgi:Holliday junction resolvase RusA-like endonuclease/endogenous inhibitor of DNA gyrase (YacG/DUF329 family)